MEFTSFELIKHRIKSGFKIVIRNPVEIKVHIDMNKISLEPGMEMVVSEERWRVSHALQMNGNDCQRGSENLWPVFPGRAGSKKFVWLDWH